MKENLSIGIVDRKWFLTLLLIILMLTLIEPAHAQAWAEKVNTQGNVLIEGLKLLGRTVATIVGLWGALMMISGRKRFSDLWEWFVGAAVFLSITELVNMFFG